MAFREHPGRDEIKQCGKHRYDAPAENAGQKIEQGGGAAEGQDIDVSVPQDVSRKGGDPVHEENPCHGIIDGHSMVLFDALRYVYDAGRIQLPVKRVGSAEKARVFFDIGIQYSLLRRLVKVRAVRKNRQ